MANRRTKVIIMGAAGRDFHNFNVFFRGKKEYEVVCFTAAQIMGIAGRKYPHALAGKLYPNGIPIYSEEQLASLIKKYRADQCVLAYSDISFQTVMEKASLVLAAGADFKLLGPESTMLKSKKPVIAVCAVRTGCGKSEVTKAFSNLLKKKGVRHVVIRHPMPYGDLSKQICERFETYEDLKKYNCTIEEREEYEGHISRGVVVYAGVDYEKILRQAEKEADIILWDGGNNDFPFYKPDLLTVIVDPHRPGHEVTYYPGMTNMLMADVIIVNKEDSAKQRNITIVKNHVKQYNPRAIIVDAASVVTVNKPKLIEKKRVLVVEDGPTLTHGGMQYGAGWLAAKAHHAIPIDPKPYAVGSIKEVYKKFKVRMVLPAMGYSPEQIKELQQTINNAKCDAVIIGTPIKLDTLIKLNKPAVRVKYELKELGNTTLEKIYNQFVSRSRVKT